MKKLIATLALALLSQSAAAELYLGAKAGYLRPSVDNADETTAGSVVVGYELADVLLADVSLEAEYTKALEEGDIGSLDWDYSNYGVFAAVRGGGPIYLRARVGMVNQEIEVNGSSDNSTGAAATIGFGFSLLGLEAALDWTRYAESDNLEDMDYVSLGLRF